MRGLPGRGMRPAGDGRPSLRLRARPTDSGTPFDHLFDESILFAVSSLMCI